MKCKFWKIPKNQKSASSKNEDAPRSLKDPMNRMPERCLMETSFPCSYVSLFLLVIAVDDDVGRTT